LRPQAKKDLKMFTISDYRNNAELSMFNALLSIFNTEYFLKSKFNSTLKIFTKKNSVNCSDKINLFKHIYLSIFSKKWGVFFYKSIKLRFDSTIHCFIFLLTSIATVILDLAKKAVFYLKPYKLILCVIINQNFLIMKRTILILVAAFLICQINVSGQDSGDGVKPGVHDEVSYTYDNAGNRIKRSIISVSNIHTLSGYFEDNQIEPEKITGEREIYVYPNPVREELTIEIWKGNEEDNYRLLLFDSTGKLLVDKKRHGNGREPVDMSQFPTGIYFLIINTVDSKKEYKIIKE